MMGILKADSDICFWLKIVKIDSKHMVYCAERVLDNPVRYRIYSKYNFFIR